MKIVWLIAGVMVSCGVGASMGACSASNTSSGSSSSGAGGTTSSSSSSSSGAGGGSSSSAGGSATGGSSGTGGSVVDAGCKTESTIQNDLAAHQPSADAGLGSATIYCPFGNPDGGPDLYCDNNSQHCCDPSSGTSTCVATGTACASGDMDWGCQAPEDCAVADAGTPVCCAAGGSIEVGDTMNGVQCENKSSGVTSTKCVATCTGLTLCTTNSDCTSSPNHTCVAFEKYAAIIGACQ